VKKPTFSSSPTHPPLSTTPRPPKVFALGFVSVFDQILDNFDASERTQVFDAYIHALGEDPKRYRVRGAGGGHGWALGWDGCREGGWTEGMC